ncbi:hypothetical protein [Methylobacterium sp. J-092]|uniref:hypothetical protein n=1 Tax=Methylobacterium sp. J-092 TaxID=2836667 RepID=UPI001FB9AEB3|nr:hypothetical protein [Methylobacterium sp. J-092]MCJ2006744.1 hypothetical protein [Methylobacterium sp. J-092]
MTVDVYRNLRRRAFSIREGGRVVGHRQAVMLRDVTFIVSAAGVRRVRSRGQREVVAFARGVLSESPLAEQAVRVRFDPYRAADFTLPDGTSIKAAAVVSFLADGSCWASNLS